MACACIAPRNGSGSRELASREMLLLPAWRTVVRPILMCASLALAAASLPTAASAQPVRGTYQRTCRNVQISRGILTADCADRDGRFRESSIPYGQCVGDIGNRDGMLNCNGATASGGAPAYPGGGYGGDRYGNGPYDHRQAGD